MTTETNKLRLPVSDQHQDSSRPHHRVEELRREYPSEYAYLMGLMRDDQKRRMVAALVYEGGMTYDELDATTSLSRRRTRSHIYKMRDVGVIDTTDSGISIVHFPNEDLRLLAEDTLSFFFN